MARAAASTTAVGTAAQQASARAAAANLTHQRATLQLQQTQTSALRQLSAAQNNLAQAQGRHLQALQSGNAAQQAATRQQVALQRAALQTVQQSTNAQVNGARAQQSAARQAQLAAQGQVATGQQLARQQQATTAAVRGTGLALTAVGGALVGVVAVGVDKAAEFEQAMSHVEAVTHASAHGRSCSSRTRRWTRAPRRCSRRRSRPTPSRSWRRPVSRPATSCPVVSPARWRSRPPVTWVSPTQPRSRRRRWCSSTCRVTRPRTWLTCWPPAQTRRRGRCRTSAWACPTSARSPHPWACQHRADHWCAGPVRQQRHPRRARRHRTARHPAVAVVAVQAKAAEELDKLGINLYDTQGHFVGINGAAEQLRTKMSGLTERNSATTPSA
jgi:hypothetical protein